MRTENSPEVAAERRADYVRALTEELDMCERAGKADRVAAIKAEIERIGGKPVARQAPASSTVTAATDPTAEKRDQAAQQAADAAAAHRAQAAGQSTPEPVAPAAPKAPAAKKAPAKKAAAKKAAAPKAPKA